MTNSNVFNPNLATSLIVLALRYEGMNDLANSCQFAHEAVSTLHASFMQRPFVHQLLMKVILSNYLRLCNAASIEMDTDLILPIILIFQQFETEE